MDQRGETVQRGVLAGEVAQQLLGVRMSQRLERERVVVRRAGPGRLVFGPEVDDRQRLRALDRADQFAQQHLARLVDPVQVLDDGDDRVAASGRPDQLADDPAQRPVARLGAQLGEGVVGVGHAEEVEEQRQVVGEGGVEQQRPAGDLLAHDPLRVAVGDAEVGAQHLQHRHEGDLAAVRLGLAFEDLDPLGPGAFGELVAEPALADPRFGDDADRGALAGLGAVQRPRQHRHLLVAADEAGEAALAREVEPRASRADARQLEDAHRPARALDLELAQVGELEEAARQLRRRFGQVGLARLGQRLHPLRQADRVADRGVVTAALAADRPGDDLAGVDPDPHREVEPVLAAQLRRVLGDVVEHPQRREAGAPGVVLVGDRGAEDGHDPVAGEFVDGALEAAHLVGEDREEALHDPAPLLRVVLLGQVHRALDVGEEHRDLLALAVRLRCDPYCSPFRIVRLEDTYTGQQETD